MDSLNKTINRKAVVYYSIAVFLTIGGYLEGLFKGEKTVLGLIILLLICLLPLIISIFMYRRNPDNEKIKSFVSIAFTAGYSYILLTFSTLIVYSLVFMMLPIITLNASKKSIYIFGFVILLANIIRIILQYKGVVGSRFIPMEHFVQIAAVMLVFMSIIGTNTVSFLHNKNQMDELNNEKAIQQKAINTTNLIMNSVRDYSSKLSENVEDLTTYSKDVSMITNNANETAVFGSNVVEKISENRDSVSQSSEKVGKSIEKLQGGVDKINETISFIYDITRQINLLSLNAAVESARSGEAGLGFAVVSEEIKNLANQTAESTKRIDEIIKELNDDVHNSVEAMTILDEANFEQNKLIEDVAETYSKIRSSMGDVANRVDTMDTMIKSVSDSNRTMIDSMEE